MVREGKGRVVIRRSKSMRRGEMDSHIKAKTHANRYIGKFIKGGDIIE